MALVTAATSAWTAGSLINASVDKAAKSAFTVEFPKDPAGQKEVFPAIEGPYRNVSALTCIAPARALALLSNGGRLYDVKLLADWRRRTCGMDGAQETFSARPI